MKEMNRTRRTSDIQGQDGFTQRRDDGNASSDTTSSFASDDRLRSCVKLLFALQNVVIRKCFWRKEMTTMTTFGGVCGSCSPDWDTKVSASVPGLRQAVEPQATYTAIHIGRLQPGVSV